MGQNKNRYQAMEKWITLHGKTYSIKYIAKPEEYKDYLQTINRMLSSLTIEPAKVNPLRNPELNISVEPYDIAVNPVTGKLYVANPRFHTISVIDGSTDRPVGYVRVQNYPLAIAVDEEMNKVFVANSRSNTVSVIDGLVNKVTANISVGQKPVAIALDNDEMGLDSLMFVVNSDSNTVSVVDTTNNTLKDTIPVGKGPGPVAINPISNRLYVANADSNTVSVIDYVVTTGGDFNDTKIGDIPVGPYPTSIALDPNTNKLYVAISGSNALSVINGRTNSLEEKDIVVGARPSSILYYNGKLYVANFGSNSVSVIDTQRRTQVTVAVGGLPVSVTVNPLSGVIYVTNLGSKTVSEIKGTDVLAGINFNVNPPNSGRIECDKQKILDKVYTRYRSGEVINCKAYPNTNFVFESWTGDLPTILPASTDETISFNASKYGNGTANFQVVQVTQELQLPREYTEQLYSVISAMMIPIIVSVIGGWSIPAVAKWMNGKRQRGYLRRSMMTISAIHETKYQNRENYLQRFEDVRRKADDLLTDGKITEEHYGILNNKITEYEEDIDRLFHD